MPKPLIQTTGRRKEAVARVRVRNGTGKITVNGRPFATYFPILTHQVIAKEPLRLTQTEEVYDVEATLDGGGVSGQAGAIRLGIAAALIALDPDTRPALKKAGLLARDAREKERRKYGLKKARKAPQYSKRQTPERRMLRFGTDGVRGDADADLTSSLVEGLGRAAARVLGATGFLVGRDTRESGPRIEADLTRGLVAGGATVRSLGVASTPAIAFLAQRAGVPAAIVSASHNAWTDNGVKLVAADGRKLADDVEAAIESALLELSSSKPVTADRTFSGAATQVGVVSAGELDAYVEHLLGALEGRTLAGLHIVVDCANGAASELAPRALRAAGARVEVLHAEPDGRNINEACGSTYPQELQAAVRAAGADLGLALDGDADRVVAVDERGELVDGDQIMVLTALDRHERGILRNDAIVVTVMSNLGLRRALTAAGVGIVETPVGDRNVTAAMAVHDLAIGGEQSGHIVFADLATTGDGVLTGLLVADVVARRGRPLSELAGAMTRLPQVLVNVPVTAGVGLDDGAVQETIGKVEAELGDRGRVMVRSSGTEPVVRVMVEAPTEAEAAAAAARVRAALEA